MVDKLSKRQPCKMMTKKYPKTFGEYRYFVLPLRRSFEQKAQKADSSIG